MKLCRLARPPVKIFYNQFPQTKDHLLTSLKTAGHEVKEVLIQPVKIPNRYLSYGLGMLLVPLQLRRMNPDLIIADNIEAGIAALLAKLFFKTLLVFHFLDDYSLIASYDRWRLRYWVLKLFEKIIPTLADLVIVVDGVKKRHCLRCGVPEHRLRMIPNGVDVDKFRPEKRNEALRKRLQLEGSEIVIFVGKINRYYRLDVVLKAFPLVLAAHPNTRFLLVGDGDAVESLKKLCEDLGIERSVVFAGFRPPEEISGLINLSDLCVFPLPDGSALAIFEYMACAKPVVLPRGGTLKMGVPKEMIPDPCMFEVEPTPQGFARGILFLLDHREIAKGMGNKARELVEKEFNWNHLANQYIKTFEQLLR